MYLVHLSVQIRTPNTVYLVHLSLAFFNLQVLTSTFFSPLKLFVEETSHIILQILPQSKFFDTMPVLFNISSVEQSNKYVHTDSTQRILAKQINNKQNTRLSECKTLLSIKLQEKGSQSTETKGLQWKEYPGDKSLGTASAICMPVALNKSFYCSQPLFQLYKGSTNDSLAQT